MHINFDRINGENVLKNLEKYIEGLISSNEKLKERVANFNKDEEIKRLQKELDDMRVNSLTVLNDKERRDSRHFSEEHFKSCKSNILYILEGTGIGMGITVKCAKCGVEEDVTDVDSW